jgi:methionyl-tRNA formyltransferase
MRIVIATQHDYLYIPEFMAPFLVACQSEGIDVARIIILKPFNEPLKKNVARMWNFYGPVDFVRQSFRYAGRVLRHKLHLNATSVPALAERHGIPWSDEEKINGDAALERLRADKADVLLSVGATQIFKAPLLSIPAWGAINVHTAALPKYRGVMPTFWALYHGDSACGMTVFKMDTAIDGGTWLLQETLPITPEETLDSLMRKTKRHEADMVIRVLRAITDGTITEHPYEGEESYFTFPTPTEVATLRRSGRRLL